MCGHRGAGEGKACQLWGRGGSGQGSWGWLQKTSTCGLRSPPAKTPPCAQPPVMAPSPQGVPTPQVQGPWQELGTTAGRAGDTGSHGSGRDPEGS